MIITPFAAVIHYHLNLSVSRVSRPAPLAVSASRFSRLKELFQTKYAALSAAWSNLAN
ncbi:hypothetical protein AB7M22_003244 [Pseudomonas sp. ADAK2 TE3594]